MPTVRYTGDGSYRVDGETFTAGDCSDVSTGLADHLVETAAFEHADDVTTVDYREVDDSADSEEFNQQNDAETLVEDGVCPWCEDYDGDNVGIHASQSHPDQWAAYKED